MSVLDELREMFARDRFKAGSGTAELLQYDTALADLADLEKAHPGLVDKTAICPRCGHIGCWSLDCAVSEAGWRIAPDWRGSRPGWEEHVLCPTCAKEAR